MSESADFAKLMGPVAEAILPEFYGDPNRALSSKTEVRYGSKGSMSVDLIKGVFTDHEDGSGGGVIDLLRTFKGMEQPEALEWLEQRGFIEPRRQRSNDDDRPSIKIPGGIPDWMKPKPIAVFEYFDDKGKLAYQVLKFPKEAPRRYMQRRPHPGGGWIWALQKGMFGKTKSGDWFKVKEGKSYQEEQFFEDAPRWLYRRHEVLAAKKDGRPVFLVEGEKDVETLREWGFTATTNAGGAKYWSEQFDEDLSGCDVVLLPDNDDAGRQRTLLRGAGLRGHAKSVRVLDLALHWKDMPEKADVSDWKADAGGTKEQFEKLVKKAPHWQPEPPRSSFGAVEWSHIDDQMPDPDYLIDGWMTECDRSVIGGPSGSGKSFLAIHIAMCVARGKDFFDNPVKKGGVIYQAGEGGRGIKKRLRAYRSHFKVPDEEQVPFVLLPSKVDLFARDGDTEKLISEIKGWALTMADPLRLVVIDTLSTATAGADENSGRDMSLVLANIARISEACGCHVMLVHHMNADGKKLRGHTSIYANVDQVILVTSDEETRIKTALLSKQKDDEDGIKIQFALAQEVLGYDKKKSRDITSCVVLSVSEKERLKKEQEAQGFSVKPSERRFLAIMFEAIDKYGKFVATKDDGPEKAIGRSVVDYKYYLDVAVNQMINEPDPQKARERERKAFERTTAFLLKAKIIDAERPYVWWTGKPIRGFSRTFPNRKADVNAQADLPVYDQDIPFFGDEPEVPF